MQQNDESHEASGQTGAKSRVLLNAQIIHGALFLGAAMFAVVAAVLSVAGVVQGADELGLILRLVFIPFCLGAIAMAWLMPRLMQSQGRDQPAEGHFQMLVVIRGALLEGAALFAGVILLLTANLADLLLVAIPLVGLILTFPTEQRWREFLAARERDENLRGPEI